MSAWKATVYCRVIGGREASPHFSCSPFLRPNSLPRPLFPSTPPSIIYRLGPYQFPLLLPPQYHSSPSTLHPSHLAPLSQRSLEFHIHTALTLLNRPLHFTNFTLPPSLLRVLPTHHHVCYCPTTLTPLLPNAAS
jgi:hypothetical protein